MNKVINGFWKQTRFKLAFILLSFWGFLTTTLVISDIVASFHTVPFAGIQFSDTTTALISQLTGATVMAVSFYFGTRNSTDIPENTSPDASKQGTGQG